MTIKVCLIGCGEHSAETILPVLRANPLCELVAVCDPVPANLQRLGPTLRGVNTYSDACSLIDSEDVQAAFLVAPPQTHFQVGRAVLEQGLHLFVEKPPAVSTAELAQLTELAERKGVVTAVGHNLRHSAAWLAAKAFADEHHLGFPASLHIAYHASRPYGNRWGLASVLQSMLLTHAVHVADLLVALADTWQVVSAQYRETKEGRSSLSTLLSLPKLATGSFGVTTCAAGFDFHAQFSYAGGAHLSISGLRQVQLFLNDGTKKYGLFWSAKALDSGYVTAGYATEVLQFLQAIQTSGRARPDFRESLNTYRILDAITAAVR